MKWSNLPQPVAARLLELDQRVNELVAQAEQAERVLENARAIINFKREDVTKAEYALVRERFDGTYAQAQTARQRADSERAILHAIRHWLETLPHNTKLCMVQPPTNGDDLGTLQGKLQALRAELTKLHSITVPADDIAAKVQAYVQVLAENAQPLLRGLGAGQQLDVRWPGGPDCDRNNGNGFSTIDGNALMLTALLQPAALAKVITNAVASTMPMPKAELEKRRSELPDQIDELSYVVAALLDRADMPPDPAMSPWHQLGVRIKEEEKATLVHV